MKKCLALSFIAFSLLLTCIGQKNSSGFGFHGGLNINSAYGNAVDNDHKSNLVGFSIGTSFKYYTSNHFGIRAILQFEQQGWAYRSLLFETSSNNVLGRGDAIFKLNYLTLPVLAEYSFGNKVKFRTGAGVFFGILLSNQIITKIKEPYTPNNTPTTKSSSEYRKPINFGLSAGVGLQIPISSTLNFDFDLRDNLGLANINKGDAAIKTNGLYFQTGLSFTR